MVDRIEERAASGRPSLTTRVFWVGLAAGGLLLAVSGSFTGADRELAEALPHLRRGWAWMAAALALEVIHIASRAARWGLLLPRPRPRWSEFFAAMSIGYLYNNVVARSGEVARMVYVGRRVPSLGLSGTAVTIATDRLIDVLMVLLLAGALVVVAPLGPDLLTASPAVAGALCAVVLGACVGLFVAIRLAPWLAGALGSLDLRARRRPLRGVIALASGALGGVRALGGLGARGWCGVAALAVTEYVLVGLIYAFVGRACGVELSALEVLTVVAASGFGAMVPSGPGNVGSMVLLMAVAAGHTAAAEVATVYAGLVFSVYFVVRTASGLGCLLIAGGRSARRVAVAALALGLGLGGGSA